MALNASALEDGAQGIIAPITHISLHSGAPGASGTDNVISGGRFPVTLTTDGNGNIELDAPVEATGLTPSATVANIGLWTASTSGTFKGFVPRASGDATTNALGEYTVTELDIPGSSS